jgi:chromosome segregation ATPase
MERVLIDEARMLAWVQEGQHVFQHVLPAVIDERDALKTQLQAVTRRCEDLQRENESLRAETARTAADHRQLEQGHADIVNSVGQFLSQLTHVLEPMRVLADKLGQARARQEGVDRAG